MIAIVWALAMSSVAIAVAVGRCDVGLLAAAVKTLIVAYWYMELRIAARWHAVMFGLATIAVTLLLFVLAL
jgi:hypothetical protein